MSMMDMALSKYLMSKSLWSNRTDWRYSTSQEESASPIVLTAGTGRLYFEHELDKNAKFSVQYDFISVGASRGAVLNYAASFKDDDSGGLTNVRCVEGKDFGPESFPVFGWMMNIGATPGAFGLSFADHGVSAGAFYFGTWPWAAILVWGKFSSILPSIGPSIGVVRYSDPLVDAGEV